MAAALAAGLALSFSPAAEASGPTLDANVSQTANAAFNSVFSFKTMGQTFTALNTGQLTQVDLYAGTFYSPTTLKIQVWNVSGGNPIAAASSVSVNGTLGFTAAWHSFPLTSPVPVTAGQQYAVVAAAGLANYFRWGYYGGANYTGGKMLVPSGSSWTPLTGLPTGSAFNFRTWVNTSAGLSIQSNQPGTTAPEGTAPTMTGTYTGAVGAVQLAADHGTVTAGATAGTWTWTGDTYDEDAAPSTVTVTVTDSTGASKSTTFSLTITGAKPTASITLGGAKQASSLSTAAVTLSTPEGTLLTLNGSATSPEQADQAFTYSWTVNGTPVQGVTGGSYTVPTTDEGTFVVTMKAKDDGGMESDAVSVTVTANEIQPTATITGIAPADTNITFVVPQATLNFNGTYSDPAPESHSFRWDFGDGTTATTLSTTHAYTAAGVYTVTLTVKDDEGVAGTATSTVKVLTPQQALATMVATVQQLTSLNQGQKNSLIAKLNAASDAIGRGNFQAAHNELNAFLNELAADLNTNKISAGAYNSLRADAHQIMGAIGTYNRFVEWWPLPA